MSRWSWEREWLPSTEARKTSRRSPSLSSGTVSVSAGTRSSRFSRGPRLGSFPSSEVEEHDDGERGQDDRNKLRCRETQHRAAWIPAEDLDDVSRHRVEEHVEPERPTRKPFAPRFGCEQDSEDEGFRAGLVELRGV